MSESQLKPEIKRFSGFRKTSDPFQVVKLRRGVEQYAPVLELIAKEPFFLDDAYRQMTPVDMVMNLLSNGEVYFCFLGEALVAFLSINQILPGRHGTFDAWVSPPFRGNRAVTHAIGKELIVDYAFAPFGPFGLGLQKLKANITGANLAAGRAAIAIGFVAIGVSPGDALHDGIPYDTVLLELLNPAYFAPNAGESLSNGPQDSEASDLQSSAELPEPAVYEPESVPGSTEPADDGSRSVLPAGRDEHRRIIGGGAPQVAAAQPRPNEPSAVRTIR